jgi:hypothetical protein
MCTRFTALICTLPDRVLLTPNKRTNPSRTIWIVDTLPFPAVISARAACPFPTTSKQLAHVRARPITQPALRGSRTPLCTAASFSINRTYSSHSNTRTYVSVLALAPSQHSTCDQLTGALSLSRVPLPSSAHLPVFVTALLSLSAPKPPNHPLPPLAAAGAPSPYAAHPPRSPRTAAEKGRARRAGAIRPILNCILSCSI